MHKYQQVADLLLSIETELRCLDIWESKEPTPEALISTQPFCVDTLAFTQWLQFVFIPKMKQLVQNRQQLPRNCSIAPMAEEHFKAECWVDRRSHVSQLLNLLKAIDETLSSTHAINDLVH